MSLSKFYQGRRILVTGITGFKGRWLATWLSGMGADVHGVGLAPDEAARPFWKLVEPRIAWKQVDVADLEAIRNYVSQVRPEIIFHMAAQPLVRLSYHDPVATFTVNVLGTVHVLEAARSTESVRAVVNVTSDKCYENREWVWGYRESDPMGGSDPYSASKGCAELASASYRRSYGKEAGLQIASVRAGNVIGGGDFSPDRIVPDIVRGILAKEPVILRRPNAIRPWLHVLEPLSGYLLLGRLLAEEGGEWAEGWNFGPLNDEILDVRHLANAVVRQWGRGEVREELTSSTLHEARHLQLDSSKAMTRLGWRPLSSMKERVAWTVEWYMAYEGSPAAALSITLEQIGRYEQRIRQCSSMSKRWSAASPGSSVRRSRAA